MHFSQYTFACFGLLKILKQGAREIAQLLRALTTLEDLSLIPRYWPTNICNSSYKGSHAPFDPFRDEALMWCTDMLVCKNSYVHKMINCLR